MKELHAGGEDRGEGAASKAGNPFCLVLIDNIPLEACEVFQTVRTASCRKCEHYTPRTEATCIGCGCSDGHACVAPVTGACFWVKVDYALGIGVCSECPEHVGLFEAWQNHAHEIPEVKRVPA